MRALSGGPSGRGRPGGPLDFGRARPSFRVAAPGRRPDGPVGRGRRRRTARLPAGRSAGCAGGHLGLAASPPQRRGSRLAAARNEQPGIGRHLLARARGRPVARALNCRRRPPGSSSGRRATAPIGRGRIPVGGGPVCHRPVRRARHQPPGHTRNRGRSQAARRFDRLQPCGDDGDRHDLWSGEPGRRRRVARPPAGLLGVRADLARSHAARMRPRAGGRPRRRNSTSTYGAMWTAARWARSSWTESAREANCPGRPSSRRATPSASTARSGPASAAWTLAPGEQWRKVAPESLDSDTIDANVFADALSPANRATAEDRGLEYVEGARARHCRIAVDGPTFAASFPQVGVADRGRDHGDLARGDQLLGLRGRPGGHGGRVDQRQRPGDHCRTACWPRSGSTLTATNRGLPVTVAAPTIRP